MKRRNMFHKLYWKLKRSYEKHYFANKYSKLVPQIYYDKKYNCYIYPKVIDEQGCCEYICGEVVKSGCIYFYCLNDKKQHQHTISEVFLLAYNESEIFSIDTEDEILYSNQELEMICKLVEQGKTDRLNYG